MNETFEYDGGFRPGDVIEVVDGTFVGMTGRVVDPDEAADLRKKNGGQFSLIKCPPGQVWVVLVIFDRPMPILLYQFQIRLNDG